MILVRSAELLPYPFWSISVASEYDAKVIGNCRTQGFVGLYLISPLKRGDKAHPSRFLVLCPTRISRFADQ